MNMKWWSFWKFGDGNMRQTEKKSTFINQSLKLILGCSSPCSSWLSNLREILLFWVTVQFSYYLNPLCLTAEQRHLLLYLYQVQKAFVQILFLSSLSSFNFSIYEILLIWPSKLYFSTICWHLRHILNDIVNLCTLESVQSAWAVPYFPLFSCFSEKINRILQ